MEMLVIYDHPKDFPDCFVVRQWFVEDPPRPGPVIAFAPTLELARDAIPFEMIRFPPMAGDDPAIVETYI